MPLHSWGSPSPSDMKFCHEILETLRYHKVKTQSLSPLVLETYRVVTDRLTDRIIIANMHFIASYLSRVKMANECMVLLLLLLVELNRNCSLVLVFTAAQCMKVLIPSVCTE